MESEKDREFNEAPRRLSEQPEPSAKAAELFTKLHPRGVFRFRTFEEFNKWKDQFGHKSPQDPT